MKQQIDKADIGWSISPYIPESPGSMSYAGFNIKNPVGFEHAPPPFQPRHIISFNDNISDEVRNYMEGNDSLRVGVYENLFSSRPRDKFIKDVLTINFQQARNTTGGRFLHPLASRLAYSHQNLEMSGKAKREFLRRMTGDVWEEHSRANVLKVALAGLAMVSASRGGHGGSPGQSKESQIYVNAYLNNRVAVLQDARLPGSAQFFQRGLKKSLISTPQQFERELSHIAGNPVVNLNLHTYSFSGVPLGLVAPYKKGSNVRDIYTINHLRNRMPSEVEMMYVQGCNSPVLLKRMGFNPTEAQKLLGGSGHMVYNVHDAGTTYTFKHNKGLNKWTYTTSANQYGKSLGNPEVVSFGRPGEVVYGTDPISASNTDAAIISGKPGIDFITSTNRKSAGYGTHHTDLIEQSQAFIDEARARSGGSTALTGVEMRDAARSASTSLKYPQTFAKKDLEPAKRFLEQLHTRYGSSILPSPSTSSYGETWDYLHSSPKPQLKPLSKKRSGSGPRPKRKGMKARSIGQPVGVVEQPVSVNVVEHVMLPPTKAEPRILGFVPPGRANIATPPVVTSATRLSVSETNHLPEVGAKLIHSTTPNVQAPPVRAIASEVGQGLSPAAKRTAEAFANSVKGIDVPLVKKILGGLAILGLGYAGIKHFTRRTSEEEAYRHRNAEGGGKAKRALIRSMVPLQAHSRVDPLKASQQSANFLPSDLRSFTDEVVKSNNLKGISFKSAMGESHAKQIWGEGSEIVIGSEGGFLHKLTQLGLGGSQNRYASQRFARRISKLGLGKLNSKQVKAFTIAHELGHAHDFQMGTFNEFTSNMQTTSRQLRLSQRHFLRNNRKAISKELEKFGVTKEEFDVMSREFVKLSTSERGLLNYGENAMGHLIGGGSGSSSRVIRNMLRSNKRLAKTVFAVRKKMGPEKFSQFVDNLHEMYIKKGLDLHNPFIKANVYHKRVEEIYADKFAAEQIRKIPIGKAPAIAEGFVQGALHQNLERSGSILKSFLRTMTKVFKSKSVADAMKVSYIAELFLKTSSGKARTIYTAEKRFFQQVISKYNVSKQEFSRWLENGNLSKRLAKRGISAKEVRTSMTRNLAGLGELSGEERAFLSPTEAEKVRGMKHTSSNPSPKSMSTKQAYDGKASTRASGRATRDIIINAGNVPTSQLHTGMTEQPVPPRMKSHVSVRVKDAPIDMRSIDKIAARRVQQHAFK